MRIVTHSTGRFLLRLAAAGGLIGPGLSGAAPTPPARADKRASAFFRPTPDALLRELASDRPDATERPFTVDAGRVRREMDFVNRTRNRRDGVRATAWDVAPIHLRLGLTQGCEVGVFVTPWRRETEQARGGPGEKRSGCGDTTVRGKLNLGGNDGGPMAWGLMADRPRPTASGGLGSGKYAGALTLPVAFEFAGGGEGGAMPVAEFRSRGVGGGPRVVWKNPATIGHEIAQDWSAYGELTSSAGAGAHRATFPVGVAWKLNAHTQLDGGANRGISRSADDRGGFAGVSRRF